MKEPLIELLAQLVAMPTLTDDTAANMQALNTLDAYFSERGLHCIRYEFAGHGALLASSTPDNGLTPAVLLAAHLDVVAGDEELFTLRNKGGKLFGRGVYDMKFAIAGYMQLVEELRGKVADYDFAVLITTDEEYGGRDGKNGTRSLVKLGLRPGVCLLPDSTAPGWDIEKLAKGVWRFDLVANGVTAHGSRPWEGESASFKLIQTLHDIKTHFAGHGPKTDTLNVGLIHGGETYNLIPSLMTAGVEIRFMSPTSHDKNLAVILRTCMQHDVEYQERAFTKPVITNLQDSRVSPFLKSVEFVTGHRPKGVVSFGASDGEYFSEVGVPCILTCPQGGRHHSDDEWIDEQSFLQFVPILHDFLDRAAKPR